MSVRKSMPQGGSFALQLVVDQIVNLTSPLDVINTFQVAFEYLELNSNLETTRFRTPEFHLKSPTTVINQVFTIPKLNLGSQPKSKSTLRISIVQVTKIGIQTQKVWNRDLDLAKCYVSGRTTETHHDVKLKNWNIKQTEAKLKLVIRTAPNENALTRKPKENRQSLPSTPRNNENSPSRNTENISQKTSTLVDDSNSFSITSTPSFASDDDSLFLKNMSCEEEKSLISNKYEIVRSIGRGSFGTVYLVRDVNTNAEYALKEILCQNENEINNAMREGFNASYLKHENLVEIKSIFVRNYHNSVTKQEELYVCILMPLYTHGDLAIHLQRRSVEEQNFTEDELLDWMIQITQGVNHLHSKEFMHRDLKPGNIFLSNDVKSLAIGDFGLAREMESTFASTVAGTLRYIAPEVLTEKRYGFGADIWSLGCIFLEMVMLVMDKNLYMDVLVNQHFYKDIIDEVTSRGYSHELGKILCDMLVRETPRMSSLDVLNRLTALRDRLQSGASEIEEASVDAPCEGECGNLATAECTTCRAYMCDECFSSTHRFGVLKQHIKMNLRKL